MNNAQFSEAILTRAHLEGVDLSHTDLEWKQIKDAHWDGATILSQEQKEQKQSEQKTQ
jgi:uncharacterized protein YjbI with pentapeptide repeats